MSSHHVVREKQEPALLVLGLDTFAHELLGQLLEWNPTVIVTPHTAEKVNAMGIKIDWLVSAAVKAADLQSDIKIMAQGDDSAAGAAMKHLVTHNYPAVNIVADDVDLKDFIFFAGKINLVIYSGSKKIYPVGSGFSKWKPAGEKIELLSHPHELHTAGLKPTGGQSFETTHDGFFTLQFNLPYLFIAEEI